MKLSDLESYLRTIVPSANTKRISQTKLRILINKGVRNVNILGNVLTKEGFFKALADVGEYVIATQSGISDYVGIGESGVWYNKGTATNTFYDDLEGADQPYLDVKVPRWRDQASGNPLYAVIETNRIIIYPKPSATLSSAFLLPDYIYAPKDMTNGDHFPFTGTTTENKELDVLDDAIISYVRWMLGLSVGKEAQGVVNRQEYIATVETTTKLLKRRPDFRSNRDFRLKGRRRS